MVTLIGSLLWGLTVWACMAVVNTLRPLEKRRGRALYAAVWGLLILAALAFLMRPEEEITTGEDPAAYFHSAQAFARHGAVTFQDPALAELPKPQRRLFRYGHRGFGNTKDACLWVKNADTATVGTWFQPAFAWLLAVPIALFTPWAAFFVAPFFALMAGLILAGLVRRVVRSETIGILAFLLFLAHPAMAWNARCMRPEMPALFFALTGITCLTVDSEKPPRGFATGLLAGLALTVAVLFHVTAIYMLIPAVLLAAWLHGQASRAACSATSGAAGPAPSRFWMGWWLGLACGTALMVVQTLYVTDPYRLVPNLSRPPIPVFATAGIVLLAAFVLALRVGPVPRFATRSLDTRPGVARMAGGAMALAFGGAMLWTFFFRSDLGRVPGLPQWLTAYLSLTDVRGVVRLSSRVWALVALSGTICLCCASGIEGKMGRRLFFVLAPASLTIGWMFNYMFETRRTTTALIPLMVLATAALMKASVAPGRRLYDALMPQGIKRRLPSQVLAAVLPCLIALGLIAAAVRGRDLLYRLRNHRGTYAFYEDVSACLRAEGDFLFAEYTQTAAPIAHFTGLPLLPVAWGYRNEQEYRQAEQALAERVHAHPDRRHLLVTPFSGTALPGLALEPMASRTLSTRLLARTRRVVPNATRNRTLSLHIFRVAAASPVAGASTYTRVMDGSRLGMEGHDGRVMMRALKLQGSPLKANAETVIELESPVIPQRRGDQPGALVLVFAIPARDAPEIRVFKGDSEAFLPARQFALYPGWIAMEVAVADIAAMPLRLTVMASRNAYLTDIAFVPDAPGPAWPVRNLAPQEPFRLDPVVTQRLKPVSALALPETHRPRRIWLLATFEDTSTTAGVLELRKRNAPGSRVEHALTPEWRWHVSSWPETREAHGAAAWHDLRVTSAAPTDEAATPDSLAMLVHAVIVQPYPAIDLRGDSAGGADSPPDHGH